MKKHLRFISLLSILLLAGCETAPADSNPAQENDGEQYVNVLPSYDEEEANRLSSIHPLGESIYNANRLKNAVQGNYDDYNRASFNAYNSSMRFSHRLRALDKDTSKSKVVTSFKNSKGQDYFVNSMDFFVKNGDDYAFGKDYEGTVRVNTNKMGYYYWETNVRDYYLSSVGYDVAVEKTFHVYADQLRTNFRAVGQGTTSAEALGFELKLIKDTVASIEYDDGSLKTYSSGLIESQEIKYVAFDIKDAGVIGIIFPEHAKVTLYSNNNVYILRQEAAIEGGRLSAGQDVSVNNRVYNDETHSFEGIRQASYIEHHPYTAEQISVDESVDEAAFLGYDFARGVYRFYLDSMGFNQSYFVTPNLKFYEKINIKPIDDRNIYVYVHCSRPTEGASIIDENGLQIPIPVEVCKNFGHENEEPVYEAGDPFYGDFIFPIKAKGGSDLRFSLVNVMQNWGNYPIKQLSSISYSIGYYHMSTGVTETNCIAPYFCNELSTYRDYGWGWFIPDFRGPSGDMWTTGDPQYNSVGIVCCPTNDSLRQVANYQTTDIHSSGLIYNDLNYDYVSDDGLYRFDMRHVEMAQLDESRTYYEIDFEMLEDATLYSEEFSIIGFDGRNTFFKKCEYLDENNNRVISNVATRIGQKEKHTLHEGSSYFSIFDVANKSVENNNFGLIVKNFSIESEKAEQVNLALYSEFGKIHSSSNYVSLTLDEDLELSKGDKLHFEIILLPYGDKGKMEEIGDNIVKVYNDSVVNELKTTALQGKLVEDSYLPTILSEDEMAMARFSGGVYGDNPVNYAVKFSNFETLGRPMVTINGSQYKYSQEAQGFDGYQVSYENGRFSYSFNITKEAEDATCYVGIEGGNK